MSLSDELRLHADEEYRAFSSRLCTSAYPMIGVRLPTLRAIAKRYAHRAGELLATDPESFEEVMVTGLAIAYADVTEQERIGLLRAFVRLIDNWSVNDSVASTLKGFQKDAEGALAFCQELVQSIEPFAQRFGIVIAFTHFGHSCPDRVLRLIEKAQSTHYYVRMAVAWAYATMLAVAPQKTLLAVEKSGIDPVTAKMLVSKARQSYRVTAEQVNELKNALCRSAEKD